jgi:hypothetical protein
MKASLPLFGLFSVLKGNQQLGAEFKGHFLMA